jgi:CubicO group peptidase (beta-lactamase class C family)
MGTDSSLETMIDAAVAEGAVPGAVLMVGIGPEAAPVVAHAAGVTGRPDGSAMTLDTVFDLASLTKVTATLPMVLHLARRCEIGLDDPVRRILPRFPDDRITLRQLLSHISGLPALRPFHELDTDPAGRWDAVLTTGPQAEPGTVMRYSDVGFMLLGRVVETVTGAALDRVAAEVVFEPLGMTDTRYRPPESWAARCAATEKSADGVATLGVVHDENAAALGGVAGHAGLFGTAADLSRYLRAWLDPESPIPGAALRAEALRCQTRGAEGQDGFEARRGLGWTLRGDRWDHMGTLWPAAGAGHTGFTGTSVAIDPVGGAWVVLLTNAVHFGRGRHGAVALRRQVHDAAVELTQRYGSPQWT